MLTGKKKWLSLIAAVMFFVFTIGIYAPYELYLSNTQEFWFTLEQFWQVPLLLSLALAAVLILIGALLRNNAFLAYLGVLFGLAVAVYLQGNFLGLNLGQFTGGSINWPDYKWKVLLNVLVWFLCVAGAVVLVFCVKKYGSTIVTGVSLLVTAMQLVSLVVLLINIPAQDTTPRENIFTDRNLYTVGSEKNIVVFVLDMFDDHYFKEILEETPEIANDFDGFTYFSNATGTYRTTMYSISSMMTGSYLNPYFQHQYAYGAMIEQAAAANPFLEVLHENGYALDIYTLEELVPSTVKAITDNYGHVETRISSYSAFSKALYRLVSWKYLPDIVKPFVWMNGTEFSGLITAGKNGLNAYQTDNTWFYTGLKDNGLSIDTETEKTFKFIHIEGPHPPCLIDENAEPTAQGNDQESIRKSARGSLKIVFDYMNQLKALGLYDSTSIIITADHGYHLIDGCLNSPLFLAKPAGASGTMTTSNAPVCQMDFDATVMNFAGLNGNQTYGPSVFDIGEEEQRERYFYQYYINEPNHTFMWRQIEYVISPESNTSESFSLTDREFLSDGTLISHKEHCTFCQSGASVPVETDENWPVGTIHYSDLPEYQWEK